MNINIAIPDRIKALPTDDKGYPVPWFVAWIDGKPDQRHADSGKHRKCADFGLCWICGQPLEKLKAFIGGPLSFKNLAYSDGPMHVECAMFSVQVCPHMVFPKAKRREDMFSAISRKAPGHINDKPEKWGLVISRKFKTERFPSGMILFRPIQPEEVRWFHAGKPCEPPTTDKVISHLKK